MDNNTIEFSIVIPVFKVEKYLPACIESVLKQSFRKFEIILVDDGSPDNSSTISDQYAQKDERIRVIHKENGGLSEARNVGLNCSKNSFIIFLDSDDFWADDDFLEYIYNELSKNQVDVIFFQRRNYYDKKNCLEEAPAEYDLECAQEKDFSELLLKLSNKGLLDESSPLKVIKRSILFHNDLLFTKGIFCEDIEWFSRLIKVVHTGMVINKPSYCYRIRKESISHTIKYKNVTDLLYSLDSHANWYYSECKDNKKRSAMLNNLCYQYCIIVGLAGAYLDGIDRKRILNKCKEYKWLCEFAINKKVNIAAALIQKFGVYFSAIVLGAYVKWKRKA